MSLKAGDWVEVRSKEEILATLDMKGRLEELPFMPQMFRYCGQQFRVSARAHKTCDVVAGTGRLLANGIHLNLRCDGQAYDGCQAACLIFWKAAWLKPIAAHSQPSAVYIKADAVKACAERDVWRATASEDSSGSGEKRYFCQATEVPHFTTPLAWWDIRQYLEDYTSGNATIARLARGFTYQAYHHGTQAWRARVGRPFRWLYDAFQGLRGGIPFPRKQGTLPPDQPAPSSNLDLRPGDLVRVKSHEAILATINKGGLNRGLLFDKEQVPFCGKTFRVKARVSKFVNEKTGRMTTLKTPAVILEGVWCQSRYSNGKMFCPRSIYSWWREVWLEKVEDAAHTGNLAADNGSRLCGNSRPAEAALSQAP